MKTFFTLLLIMFVVGLTDNVNYAQEEASQDETSFIYEDNGKRDPFWPLVSKAGTIINYDSDYVISDLILEGIVAGVGGSSIAIINGKIVKENDKIGQFIVSQISANNVVLKQEDQKFELKLKKGGK